MATRVTSVSFIIGRTIAHLQLRRSVKFCRCISSAVLIKQSQLTNRTTNSASIVHAPSIALRETSVRSGSSKSGTDGTDSKLDKTDELSDENTQNLTIFQKFKLAYKKQGKVLIYVHVATSAVWYGSFYLIASFGLDLTPILQQIGASDSITNYLADSGLGSAAMAYFMYKIATPFRYAVTLGGTNMAIKRMRKSGRMDPVPEGAKFKDFYKDGRDLMREKQRLKKESPDKEND